MGHLVFEYANKHGGMPQFLACWSTPSGQLEGSSRGETEIVWGHDLFI